MSKTWKIVSASVLFVIILAIGVKAMGANSEGSSTKKFAWENLSAGLQDEVTTEWKDATIEKTKLKEKFGQFDEKYIDQEVYAITFKVSENSVLGDITAYVSLDGKTFIGVGIRE